MDYLNGLIKDVEEPGGSKFFAILYRLKYMGRWSLMHNLWPENVMEHSYMVAVIAYALAIRHNECAGLESHQSDSEDTQESSNKHRDSLSKHQVDVGKVVICALMHDCAEAITGDIPTPIKHYSDETVAVYREVEDAAMAKMLSELGSSNALHDSCRNSMYYAEVSTVGQQLSIEDTLVKALVKAADNLSALIKCIEELRSGNEEFQEAYTDTLMTLEVIQSTYPEVGWFMDNFLDSFGRSRQALGCGIAFQKGEYNLNIPLSEQRNPDGYGLEMPDLVGPFGSPEDSADPSWRNLPPSVWAFVFAFKAYQEHGNAGLEFIRNWAPSAWCRHGKAPVPQANIREYHQACQYVKEFYSDREAGGLAADLSERPYYFQLCWTYYLAKTQMAPHNASCQLRAARERLELAELHGQRADVEAMAVEVLKLAVEERSDRKFKYPWSSDE